MASIRVESCSGNGNGDGNGDGNGNGVYPIYQWASAKLIVKPAVTIAAAKLLSQQRHLQQ